ncbi:hypothetical protein ACFXTH_008797 [Malus domestica]
MQPSPHIGLVQTLHHSLLRTQLVFCLFDPLEFGIDHINVGEVIFVIESYDLAMELNGLSEIKALLIVGGEGSELTGKADGSDRAVEKIREGIEILELMEWWRRSRR